MGENLKNNASECDVAKKEIESFLHKNVRVRVQLGSAKSSKKEQIYVGELSSVSKNLFCIKQKLGKTYSNTVSFTINDYIIKKVVIKEIDNKD